MTEEEWLACTDPQPMLDFLRGKASERKLRLFACACVKRIWPMLQDESARELAEVAEEYAEGLANEVDVRRVQYNLDRLVQGDFIPNTRALCAVYNSAQTHHAWDAADYAARDAALAAVDEVSERQAQTHLLRDIFGNPFCLLTVDPDWLTGTVGRFAQAIYDECDFERLPVLADALEEANCTDAILSHCRGSGPHVRGCWVIDLLLGKG